METYSLWSWTYWLVLSGSLALLFEALVGESLANESYYDPPYTDFVFFAFFDISYFKMINNSNFVIKN